MIGATGRQALSAVAFVLSGLAATVPSGPDTCVPVGAIILLAIASPRDIWEIARKAAGLDERDR